MYYAQSYMKPGVVGLADAGSAAALLRAQIAFGALTVVDNIVFHWLLAFHRFKRRTRQRR